jgi:protein SCO1
MTRAHHAWLSASPEGAGLPAANLEEPGRSRRQWLGAALQAAVAASGALAGAAPSWARPAVAREPSFYDSFKGMRLLDQNGRPLQPHTLLGRVVLFNFIFTACSTVCPVQTQSLLQVQGMLPAAVGKGVQLVSVSLDPLSDTPQTLKAFAKRFGADHSNWSFVTGRPQDVERLAETLMLFQNGKGKAPLDTHSTSLWLVDAQGQLRVRYSGSPVDVGRLVRELGQLVELGRNVTNKR